MTWTTCGQLKQIDFPADKNKFLDFSTRLDPPKFTKIFDPVRSDRPTGRPDPWTSLTHNIELYQISIRLVGLTTARSTASNCEQLCY